MKHTRLFISMLTLGSIVFAASYSNVFAMGAPPVSRIPIWCAIGLINCNGGTPPPTATPSVSPTVSPTASSGGPWLQVQGRVHSNGVPPLQFYSINITVPATKVFNLVRALTSARKDITVSPGMLTSPSPFPVLTQYDINSTLDYAKLYARKPNDVQILSSESTTTPINGNGVYQTQSASDGGNHLVRGSWTVNSGQYFVIFVEGNLTVQSNISVQKGGFLAFIVKGHINIDKSVTNLEGIYYTDSEFCTACDKYHTKQ